MSWETEQVDVVGLGMGQRWRMLNEILVNIFNALNELDARLQALENPPPP